MSRDRIELAALSTARRIGVQGLTRARIAAAAGVSEALVSYHMGTKEEIERWVVETAVERGMLPIVANAIACNHPAAAALPRDLKEEALRTLL